METLIVVFILIGIGIVMGWYLREYYAMRVVNTLLKEVEEQAAEEEPQADRIKMRLERHGEVIYAFKDEDNSFIAQGKDLFELDEAIVARFPGKKFSIREDNLTEIEAKHESV